MRVAIVGSRDYPDEAQVRAFVRRLAAKHPDVVIVSGGARGVDFWAVDEAAFHQCRFEVWFPDWKKGRGAGLARNQQIVDDSDIVCAFQVNESRGTADTIRKARAAGKPTYVYGPEDAGKEQLP